ncbi:MAG: acyltransferase [Pseudomonadota bacterium]
MQAAPNRFDLLRLVFASLVFLYHAIVLGSVDPTGEWEQGLALLAELSIQGFFVVSGVLVYGSFERSRTVMDYAGKRVRRLYPAYAVIILLPALVSLALTNGEAGALPQILEYLGVNLVFLNFLQPELPGLFESNRFPEVNGALWTLKIEVMFYLALPVLAWILSKLGRLWWFAIVMMIFGAFAWRELSLAYDHPLSDQLARQLPGQMMYFAAGMALRRVWGLARAQSVTLLLVGVMSLIGALLVPWLEPLRVLGLTGIIAGIAFLPGPALNVARWGDISYGVYIVHFPILQTLVALGVFATYGVAAGLALAIGLVFVASYLLWWIVEKPALRQDSHYRKASKKECRDE